jgi:hypothetical protein
VTAFDGKRQSRFGGCLGDNAEASASAHGRLPALASTRKEVAGSADAGASVRGKAVVRPRPPAARKRASGSVRPRACHRRYVAPAPTVSSMTSTLLLLCLQARESWLTAELTGPSAAPWCCIPAAKRQPLPRRSASLCGGARVGSRAGRAQSVLLAVHYGAATRVDGVRQQLVCSLLLLANWMLSVPRAGRSGRPRMGGIGSCRRVLR